MPTRTTSAFPTGAIHRHWTDQVWYATAAVAIEIVSPGDETWEKLGFYAAHAVDEVLIVDPEERRVHWLRLAGEGYEPTERSGLIELGPDELAARIDWP